MKKFLIHCTVIIFIVLFGVGFISVVFPEKTASFKIQDKGTYPDYLSIVACFKNEAPYLKEWIEYHHMLGVDRFYLYNNESDDNFMEVLRPYINSGLVVYTNWPGKAQQIPIYADAIKKIKDKTRWAAIIDIDEFILPMEVDSIPELLKDYEDYGALAMFWRGFDSNGHVQKPDGLVIENYTRVHKDPKMPLIDGAYAGYYIKSIINPRLVVGLNDPHYFYMRDNLQCVDENFIPILGTVSIYHTSKKIRLNHYYSKSEEEYFRKINRNRATGKPKYAIDPNRYKFSLTQQDTTILRFLPELKKRMK